MIGHAADPDEAREQLAAMPTDGREQLGIDVATWLLARIEDGAVTAELATTMVRTGSAREAARLINHLLRQQPQLQIPDAIATAAYLWPGIRALTVGDPANPMLAAFMKHFFRNVPVNPAHPLHGFEHLVPSPGSTAGATPPDMSR